LASEVDAAGEETRDIAGKEDVAGEEDVAGVDEDAACVEEDIAGSEEDIPGGEENVPGGEAYPMAPAQPVSSEACPLPSHANIATYAAASCYRPRHDRCHNAGPHRKVSVGEALAC
jgi:hypothetical protein